MLMMRGDRIVICLGSRDIFLDYLGCQQCIAMLPSCRIFSSKRDGVAVQLLS